MTSYHVIFKQKNQMFKGSLDFSLELSRQRRNAIDYVKCDFLIGVCQNKWPFLITQTKLDKKDIILQENIKHVIWYNMPWPGLVLISTYNKCKNEHYHRTLRPKWRIKRHALILHGMGHSCSIFIWWPYVTWKWPWRLRSIISILIWRLLHPLRSN